MTAHPYRATWLALACAWVATSASAVTAVKLNDTGANLCRDDAGVMSTACVGTAQDGEVGRDVTANVGTDGRVGFSFSKVCNNGALGGTTNCPATAVLGNGVRDWGCTKDLRTGLVWEVKTADGGWRDQSLRYNRLGDGTAMDAKAYVNAVNTKGLCGAKTWRLPTRVELQGIVDYGVPAPGPTVDSAWFPNTYNGFHWTSDDYQLDGVSGWGVGFYGGYLSYRGRASLGAVRLVRGTKAL